MRWGLGLCCQQPGWFNERASTNTIINVRLGLTRESGTGHLCVLIWQYSRMESVAEVLNGQGFPWLMATSSQAVGWGELCLTMMTRIEGK